MLDVRFAVIEGVARKPNQVRQSRGLLESEVPPKVPRALQDKPLLSKDTKQADAETPVNNLMCLASAIADLLSNYSR